MIHSMENVLLLDHSAPPKKPPRPGAPGHLGSLASLNSPVDSYNEGVKVSSDCGLHSKCWLFIDPRVTGAVGTILVTPLENWATLATQGGSAFLVQHTPR